MEHFTKALEDLGTAEGTMVAPASIKSECASCVLARTLKSNISAKEKQTIEETKSYLQERIVLFNENLLDYHRENEAILEVLEYRKKCLSEIQVAEKAVSKTREKLEKSKPDAQAKLQAELTKVSFLPSHSLVFILHTWYYKFKQKAIHERFFFSFLLVYSCLSFFVFCFQQEATLKSLLDSFDVAKKTMHDDLCNVISNRTQSSKAIFEDFVKLNYNVEMKVSLPAHFAIRLFFFLTRALFFNSCTICGTQMSSKHWGTSTPNG